MDIEQMREKLQGMLLEKRFKHSVFVMETACEMAKIYGADIHKATVAGLLHDCAKNYSTPQMLELCSMFSIVLDDVSKKQHGLIHAFLGAEIAKRFFDVHDSEIYDAIYYHTVGKPAMPLLTKIIYVADSVEPQRAYSGVERLRELAFNDIDKAVIYQIDLTIKSVLKRGTLLHPNTVDTRNYYLCKSLQGGGDSAR